MIVKKPTLLPFVLDLKTVLQTKEPNWFKMNACALIVLGVIMQNHVEILPDVALAMKNITLRSMIQTLFSNS